MSRLAIHTTTSTVRTSSTTGLIATIIPLTTTITTHMTQTGGRTHPKSVATIRTQLTTTTITTTTRRTVTRQAATRIRLSLEKMKTPKRITRSPKTRSLTPRMTRLRTRSRSGASGFRTGHASRASNGTKMTTPDALVTTLTRNTWHPRTSASSTCGT